MIPRTVHVMANEPSDSVADGVSRRKFIVAAGATGATGLAGCAGNSGGSGTGANGGGSTAGSSEGSGSGETSASSGGNQAKDTGTLSADGSSTVYPITSLAGSYWNSNPPASDKEYWGPGQYDIDTDKALADYWAGLYGFDTGSDGPPFKTSIGLSHSGVGLEKLKNQQVDIGDSSAPVKAELSDASDDVLKKFTDHVVGVDAQPIVVSKEIYDAGVKKLTIEQLRKIYKGEIKNWSELSSYSGPDKEIQAVGRAVGSGTDTSFRLNVFGSANAKIPGVDVRKGENQQVASLVEKSNNAIAYMALAFVDEKTVPPVALEIKGTTYEYGKNLAAKEYPLSRDLHAYTWEGTSKKEAAFLRMIISDYGQEKFVKSNDYVALTDKRQKEELSKLPSTDA